MAKSSQLEQLKQMTTVVADTGDIEAIAKFQPQDATTNPSLVLKAAALDNYQQLLIDSVSWAKQQSNSTEQQVIEIAKCMEEPAYFITKYIKIVSIDEGLVPFNMYKFQEKMVHTFHNNRFSICKLPRQSGKSTTIIAYLLHQVIFNDNINVAILANKSSTARDLLGRLQLAYENLPTWLQQGVLNWNKGSLELENGSKILASATSSSAVRFS